MIIATLIFANGNEKTFAVKKDGETLAVVSTSFARNDTRSPLQVLGGPAVTRGVVSGDSAVLNADGSWNTAVVNRVSF